MTAQELANEIRQLNNQIRIFYNMHYQAFRKMHNLIEERDSEALPPKADRLQDQLLEFPNEILDRIEI